jgi:transcriptional regulator with XRE-family HTH domain
MQRRTRQIQPANLKIKAIGVIVCEFRRKAGFSQERLGSECGFDRTYISRLERGILNPTTIRLWKIADTLKTPLHRMVSEMEAWATQQEKMRR